VNESTTDNQKWQYCTAILGVFEIAMVDSPGFAAGKLEKTNLLLF